MTAVNNEIITYEATAGEGYEIKDLGAPVETYYANTNDEGCPITYTLVNKDSGEAVGEESMLTLAGTILKLDENKYVKDSTIGYLIKAETLSDECTCNAPAFKTITIS